MLNINTSSIFEDFSQYPFSARELFPVSEGDGIFARLYSSIKYKLRTGLEG